MEESSVPQRRSSARQSGQKRPFYGSPSKAPSSSSRGAPSSSSKRIKTVVKRNRRETAPKVGSVHSVGECPGTKVEGECSDTKAGEYTEKLDPEIYRCAKLKVKEALRRFNEHYLHWVQEEEKRCRRGEVNDAQTPSPRGARGSRGTQTPSPRGARGSRGTVHDAQTPSPRGARGSRSRNENGRRDDTKATAKRPDLKAIKEMKKRNTLLYREKRPGNLPGVDVGHQFYSRAEMVVVGVHSHWLSGIDSMGKDYRKQEKYKGLDFPIAVSIVLSGMYEDDLDNAEDIVYTGQGGNDILGNKRQVKDQVLKSGNLALKNSMEHCVPVRVTRGHGSGSSYTGKVYTYDGLYNVVQYWEESGISGYKVFKYRLKRLSGQPVLTTNQVQFTRARAPLSIEEVNGLVCKDISGGQEDIPIPATNLVDNPPVEPMGYTYCKSIQVAENVKLPMSVSGCNCRGTCTDPSICACARRNGTDFPYVHKDGGRLIKAKSVVYECGPKCGCGPGCVNKTSQRGLKYRYEVYRTPKKGWAVRCWDFIPSGAPVCEYIGRLMRTDEIDHLHDNNFIFDIDCLQTMKGLDGREKRLEDDSPVPSGTHLDESNEKKIDSVPEFCIDAGSVGNMARFINHSCDPNLFVQCVLSSHHDIQLARVMLFAAENIPPMQELTYDYGYPLDSVLAPDGQVKKMACYCGATNCRKRLY